MITLKLSQRVRDGPAPAPTTDHRHSDAELLDLFAATLAAGLSVAAAAAVVAETTAHPGWASVAAQLAVGVAPHDAWQAVGPEELRQLVCSSAEAGASLVTGCRRLADAMRADAADHRVARAERAGVLIALPLTLLFLPAFFILGLIPIVISLAT